MKITNRIYLILLATILFLSLIIYLIKNPILGQLDKNKPILSINKERLYSDVKKLTLIRPYRNFRNISSIENSADYILNEFKKLGFGTEIQEFWVGKNKYKNVICSIGPRDAERIIIGAHYDVYGNQPGADDNASGIAGVLELARLFKQRNPELKHRIDFIAYTLEESPFFKTEFMGSAIHAKSLFEARVKVKVMICLEMIGFYSDKSYSQHFPNLLLSYLYPSKGNFILVVGKLWQRKLVRQIKRGSSPF